MERKERVSKDGKASYSVKKVINGVKMDFSFLDNIMDNYDSKVEDELSFTKEEKKNIYFQLLDQYNKNKESGYELIGFVENTFTAEERLKYLEEYYGK